jgi:hypothetical protein
MLDGIFYKSPDFDSEREVKRRKILPSPPYKTRGCCERGLC